MPLIRRPARLRTAYGPRAARLYAEDVPRLTARQIGAGTWSLPMEAVPLPGHRAVRWFVRCPSCQERRAALYSMSDGIRCRRCAGLPYRSQYAGRRPEAAAERLDALLASAQAARRPETAQRRRAYYDAAADLRDRRDEDHFCRQVAEHTVILAWARCLDAWIDTLGGRTEATRRAYHRDYMRAWRAQRRGLVQPFPPPLAIRRVGLASLMRAA